MDEYSSEEIAIIGMAGRFPRADDLATFWSNLRDGVECISFYSDEELLAAGEAPRRLEKPNFVKAQAMLEGFELFDADFFGFSPREAEITSPQHRLFLECTWQALEDAGYDPATEPGAIGVFASASSDGYILDIYANPEIRRQVGLHRAQLGNEKEFLPTWLSYKLNLKGPSVNVQTACSSSLVAVHMACQSLLNSECDLALAGGVSVRSRCKSGYFYYEGDIFSPDGRCRTFDARAQGTINGDGVGVVLLKPLEQALEDGDNVRAVIKGSAINNDGSSKVGFTAPSLEGQTRVISEAQSIAEVEPEAITYVEAHGTGTRLGDPIEIGALTDAFRAKTEAKNFCVVGAVKTNIGHLDAAAGIAGLIKTVLALEHRQLPPTLHFDEPNPEIDFAESPFRVHAELADWPPPGEPADRGSRRAGVSAFGIGGTNAHVIVEEAPEVPSHPSKPWQLLVLSARTAPALEAAAANLRRFLEQHRDIDLADVAFTLQHGRRAFAHRRAFACRDLDDAVETLASPGPQRLALLPEANKPRSVAFLFPGQGTQRPGMGRELYRDEAVFRDAIDRCAEILRPDLEGDLRQVLFPAEAHGAEAEHRLEQTQWTQPAVFVFGYALAQQWMSWGIRPQAMIGHSVGEYVAACLAGVLELEESLALVAARGRLMQGVPAGGMLAVPMDESEVVPLLGDALELAAVNAPQRTVVTGPLEALDELERQLTERGCQSRRLKTSHAFHSRMMDPIVPRFAEQVRKMALHTPQIPFLSNVTGDWITEGQATDPEYWARQLRSPVRFSDGIDRLLREKDAVFLELGPGLTLSGFVQRHRAAGESHAVVPALRRRDPEQPETASLYEAMGQLWVAGVAVDWSLLTGDKRRRRVSLPTYPFERRPYLIEPQREVTSPPPQETVQADPSSPDSAAADVSMPDTEAVATKADQKNKENLMPDLTVNPVPAWHGQILDVVKDLVHDLTGVPQAEIDPHVSFLEVGVDSLLMIQASQRLEERFGIKIPLVQMLEELTTLERVTDHLEQELGEERLRELFAPAPVAAPPPPSAVREMAPAPDVGKSLPAASGEAVSTTPPVATAAVAPVAPTAGLPAPLATVPPGAPLSGVQELITQQLQIMSQQLLALQGGPPTPAVPGPAPVPAPGPPAPPSPPAAGGEPAARPRSAPAAAEAGQEEHPAARSSGLYRPSQVDPKTGLSEAQHVYLEKFVQRYNRRTAKSKELVQSYRPVLADGRTSAGFRRLWKELVYPIHGSRAQGSRVWDVDGNEYVDVAMGFGLHYFGHSPEFVVEALERQMREGIAIGPQSPLAGRAAQLVCELTGMDRAVFCNSGTEAVMGALRAARTYTRRNKIVLLSGSYHGWFDGTLARGQMIGGERVSVPVAPGVPPAAVSDVLIADYATEESLDLVEAHLDELAAVLVEPVRSRTPHVQPREFLRRLAEIVSRSETLLIFDEMVTGFRIHSGGAQAYFGVEADLATYGKLIAGGLPIGVVAGRRPYMDMFDGGMWSFGDDSYPRAEKTMFAGAFFKHPLVMAASQAVLGRMKQEGPDLQARLNARTARLIADLNGYFQSAGVPIDMVHCGPLFRFRVPRELPADLFFYHLIDNGIYYSVEVGNCFLSTAHSDEDLERIKDAVRRSVEEMQSVGLLPGPPSGDPSGGRRTLAADGTRAPASVTASAQAEVPAVRESSAPRSRRSGMDFSLYFFGNYEATYHPAKYDLLLQAVRFADEHGFTAVWLPERHFDSFGGFSPNPSVLAAALARETRHLHLRAGSVVVPLHPTIRLAEEWSLVDNLSHGRAGVSFASGWHANDFVFAPENYENRRELMYQGIEEIRALWRGESLQVKNGLGKDLEVSIYPLPTKREIPFWITAASAQSYVNAGKMGAGVLTNLQTQSLEDLERHVTLYYDALEEHGHDRADARVALLQHTLIGADFETVRQQAAEPLRDYLKSSFRLVRRLVEGQEKRDIDFDKLSPEDFDYMITSASQRYASDRALIGTPESCAPMVERLLDIGVTEIGCLLDFGLEPPSVLEGLTHLKRLKQRFDGHRPPHREEATVVAGFKEVPLTDSQRSLWVECQMDSDACRAYNEPMTLRFHGPLDLRALRVAVQAVVDRHGVLRAGISPDGARWRIPDRLAVDFDQADFSGLGEQERDAQATRWLRQRAGDVFDLERGPLFRCGVAKLGDDDHFFDFTMHHLIIDGHSGAVMIQELIAIYDAARRGETISLGEVKPFAEHIGRMVRDQEEKGLAEAEAYWTELFADAMPFLELPTDRPRPPVALYAGGRATLDLEASLMARLRTLGIEQRTTSFMTALAAFGALLHRLAGQGDLVVGLPMRDPAATGSLVGYFLTLTPIRMQVESGESFAEYLKRVRRRVMEAQVHPYPLSLLVAKLNPARHQGQATIAVHFNLERGGQAPRFPDLEAELVSVHPGVSRFDLQLTIYDRTHRGQMQCDYRSHLFDATTVRRWLRELEVLLRSIVEDPQQPVAALPLMPEAERHQLLVEWNDTLDPVSPDLGFHGLFEAQVRRTPEATAAVYKGEPLSYDALNRRANRLARHLRQRGVGLNSVVAILGQRSLDFLTTMLALFKARAAYLPLDPLHPTERMAQVLERSRPLLALVDDDLDEDLSTALRLLSPKLRPRKLRLSALLRRKAAEENLALRGEPGDLAYVLYTSGSTGVPKGAMVEQGGMLNHLFAKIRDLDIRARDVVAQNGSQCFDVSVWQFLAALLVGGRVHIFPVPQTLDPALLLDEAEEAGVTILEVVPSMMQALVEKDEELGEHGRKLADLRWMVPTGEALPPELSRRWFSRYPLVPVINAFGPTECSDDTNHFALYAAPPPELTSIPIGRPVNNTRIYVVDRRLHPVPIGVRGEICVGGDGVGRGYFGDPGRTAEVFVPDPFVDSAAAGGARLYRTHDLGTFPSNGEVLFFGRMDFQVKIRGFRIELGEIESVLHRDPAVEQAVAVGREYRPGDHRLVAYVVAAHGATLRTEALRDLIRSKLPEYMLPSAFMVLDALPLTPNGKVDRKRLPEPEMGEAEDLTPPSTPTEEVLAGLWSELLGHESFGRSQSFFELGGHSLLATQLISRIRRVFDVELVLRVAFEYPTLGALAAQIDELRRDASVPAPPPLEQIDRTERLPLSFAQQRLWFLEQLDPGGTIYNLPAAFRLRGPLDHAVLCRSLSEIVRRHEALRTRFVAMDGEPVQLVAEPAPVKVPLVDLRDFPEPEVEARRQAAGEFWRAFDLEHGPLLRVVLLQLAEEHYVAILNMHHIVSDGWSLPLFMRELVTNYQAFERGESSPLPALPIQYADFASWQRRWLEGEVMERELAYWRQQLAGAPALLELPTDRPRPAIKTFRGALRREALSPELIETLEALGRRHGVTLYMTLLTAVQGFLARYSGSDDIVVGSPISGRNRLETEALIGFFVNTLVLRTSLAGDATVEEVMARVREVTLAAYAHQDVPFERLVEELRPERNLSHTPLFQVMFVMQEGLGNEPGVKLPGLELSAFDVGNEQLARFDLTLLVEPAARGLSLELEYNVDLFDDVTAERMLAHLSRLLREMAADPQRPLSALPLLSATQCHQVLVEWNRRAPGSKEPLVHELFEERARRRPEDPALVFEGQELSYGELDRLADRLADHLSSRGVGTESLVGLCVEPSIDMIVGLLGVLKAGGAYVPLDPTYPEDRLTFMLEDSRVELVLAEERFRPRLGIDGAKLVPFGSWEAAGRPETAPRPSVRSANAAYTIYTSGSTGAPKGVVAHHGGLADFTRSMAAALELGPGDRMLQFASLSFDASAVQIFPTLTSGAALVLHRNPGGLSSGELLELARHTGVTVLDLPAALWRQWISDVVSMGEEIGAPMRVYLTGGETVPVALLRDWAELVGSGIGFLSSYGPTETTVTATVFQTNSDEVGRLELTNVPIGHPLGNTAMILLDERLRPVPIGVPGEIYIGGAGVTRGYLGHPGLTAEHFVPDAWTSESGARAYRTGDLGRHQADGALVFLGRRDHQVKIRGYRVELGEIEAAIDGYPGVQETVVALQEQKGDRRLVAYVVAEQPELFPLDELRNALREVLPPYMVPSLFVPLAELPLNPSGKVDRQALPVAAPAAMPQGELMAPRSTLELALAQVWEELLNVWPIGIHDNFFELGGHSLLSIRLIALIKSRFGKNLPLAALFEGPTIAQMAQSLRQQGAAPAFSPLVAIQPRGSWPPFFCVHPIGGQVLGYYHLAKHLGTDQPFYGLQAPSLAQDTGPQRSIEEMAADYLGEIRKLRPHGPYLLGGASFGGVVAFEMAQQLLRQQEEVPVLTLFDTPAPRGDVETANYDPAAIVALLGRERARQMDRELAISADDLKGLAFEAQLQRVLEALRDLRIVGPEIDEDWLRHFLERHRLRMQALERYQPSPYPHRILQIRSRDADPLQVKHLAPEERRRFEDPTFGWGDLAARGVEVLSAPGFHETMMDEPNVREVARLLREQIERLATVVAAP